MAIATLTPDAAGIAATTGVIIEKGTPLFVEPKSGPTCRFRTAYKVTLWPLEVRMPRFAGTESLTREQRGSAVKTLVLPLDVLPGGRHLDKLPLNRLRFYLGGNRFDAFALYDLLFANRDVRAYVRPAGSRASLPGERLSGAWLEPVGFERDDDVLPYPDNAHPGHRLVQEYFAFPDKFLFFDVVFATPLPEGTAMEIVILLDEPPPPALSLRSDSFRLGSTPIINLFPKTTEPIRLDHLTSEYRLIADVRRERTTEIHSIVRVLSTGQGDRGEARVYDPFFSYVHRAVDDATRAFWHARRAPCSRRDVPGSDMWISLVDLAFQPASLPVEAVYAETLCTNRDLAEEIDEQTPLQFERGGVAATAICATKPSQQVQPPAGGDALWRLVSNLTLGHIARRRPAAHRGDRGRRAPGGRSAHRRRGPARGAPLLRLRRRLRGRAADPRHPRRPHAPRHPAGAPRGVARLLYRHRDHARPRRDQAHGGEPGRLHVDAEPVLRAVRSPQHLHRAGAEDLGSGKGVEAMAAYGRGRDAAVTVAEALFTEGHRFDFSRRWRYWRRLPPAGRSPPASGLRRAWGPAAIRGSTRSA